MLWRFGLQHASNIDKLLEKEDLALEEVLNDPDLQQEVREQNPKLIAYLVLPTNIKQMVEYIATEEFFKFSKMASTSCEVLCSNSAAFVDALSADYVARDFAESDDDEEEDDDDDDEEGDSDSHHNNRSRNKQEETNDNDTPKPSLLDCLWGIMRLPSGQLDMLQATYFSRVMCSLLQRKPYETLDYICAQDDAVTLFLNHLGVSAVVDLLLKVISLEELDNGPGIIAWLSQNQLIPMLVDRLAPECDPDQHSLVAQVLLDIIAISQCNNPAQPTIGTNALIDELKGAANVERLTEYMLDRSAPHATSTLVNCVYIFIELIRRNYSDDGEEEEEEIEEEEDTGIGGSEQEVSERRLPPVDLSEMMRVLAMRVEDLAALLTTPRSTIVPVPTTQGLREPLGFERLRICELFAELLHCSNMPRLNLPIIPSSGSASLSPTTLEIPLDISSPTDHDTTNTPVGQLLKWKLIQHNVLPICCDLFFRFTLNNFLHSVVYDIMHQVLNLPLGLECNVALILVAFRDVRITSRIAQACALNEEVSSMPRGVRLGYMGHLTGIGEEVARLLELSGAALEPLIAPYIDGDEWLDYVARTLQEVRERDQQPLGGERPGGSGSLSGAMMSSSGALGDADIDMLASDSSNQQQVFVSRMGFVDPSSVDDDDEDDEDIDVEDHSGYIRSHQSLFYGHADDDDDDDDVEEEDRGVYDDDDGPAERIGRYASYQNEPAPFSDDEDPFVNQGNGDSSMQIPPDCVVDVDNGTGPSSSQPVDAQPRHRPLSTTAEPSASPLVEKGKKKAPPLAPPPPPPPQQQQQQQKQKEVEALFPPLNPPEMPPRPSMADCTNFLANLSISTNGNGESHKKKQQQEAIPFNMLTSPLDAPLHYPFGIEPNKEAPTEPKGRIKDLFHESKQRSRSSSELDSIVPADIANWDPPPPLPTPGVSTNRNDSKPNGRSQQLVDEEESSFSTRRRRSRSQSAGVGVSRAMVIQAAIQGQFPYLDAKTCEFVGQLKSDTVTLGGAAAGPNREGSSSSAREAAGAARQRSKTVNSSNNGSSCARFQPSELLSDSDSEPEQSFSNDKATKPSNKIPDVSASGGGQTNKSFGQQQQQQKQQQQQQQQLPPSSHYTVHSGGSTTTTTDATDGDAAATTNSTLKSTSASSKKSSRRRKRKGKGKSNGHAGMTNHPGGGGGFPVLPMSPP
ncbi:sporulation-induced protein [Coemansia sp. RSA 1813]|nr:sporulation-induced protein [Coemansia sp. RSA 986]KAJ2210637.1 sporulation-induced protein [Coemansia sp. RSA 487]KAJ2563382.1 sporulation-induced protein [Coemansia sp. RSA 1813]